MVNEEDWLEGRWQWSDGGCRDIPRY
jgi:hypothetical protein